MTGYFIEKRSNYSTRWVPLNRAPISLPTYTVRDVTEGDDCEYRITAANDAGVGPPSETTGIVTARDLVTKPGPPTGLSAELDASGKVAQLRWKKPASDGQSPIINYVVEMRSNKAPRWKVSTLLVLYLITAAAIIIHHKAATRLIRSIRLALIRLKIRSMYIANCCQSATVHRYA